MQQIQIEPTYKTPKVSFDPSNGSFRIEGKSILVNVEEFYGPLLNWMDKFVERPTVRKVVFIFDIEYINVASTKRFLFFLYKLKDLSKKDVVVEIEWHHHAHDDYMLEVGQDLAQMLEIPIVFKSYQNLSKAN